MQTIQQQLNQCRQKDRQHFYRRWLQVKHKPKQDIDYQALQEALSVSIASCEQRKTRLPSLTFPSALPVSEQADTLCQMIKDHQVIVVAGETGSGKTTQLPKICLAAGRGIRGMIAHTQPRRIAARTVAARMADELQSDLGQHIGFQTRFSENWSDDNFIKVMTDGILLAELQRDRFLNQYDTIIIDEAHERSLNIDFLLGYLQGLLKKRRDLKLIITSATIEPERFAAHFDQAPIIQVSGRTYPVETWYRPLAVENKSQVGDISQAIVAAAEELMIHGPGDILVFLSGEREIREAADKLRKQQWRAVEILPLYARLSLAEQASVFKTSTQRRIVLATNVAETSITVPGIHYVIDVGLARISQYSYRNKIQRLPIVKISQASAMQRQGRCGRVAAGVCIRLYDEDDFQQRPEFTLPEILRTNLAAVILQLKAWRLGELEDFAFLDKPDPRFIRDGYRLLHELTAIDEQQKLTPLGKSLAHFPIDPRLARILMAAKAYACVKAVVIIVSLLSIQDPRERPLEKRQASDEAHGRFKEKNSDFIAILHLWQFIHEHQAQLSHKKFRLFCRENFLSVPRVLEWQEVYRQLLRVCRDLHWQIDALDIDYANIHNALLSGLLGNIGYYNDDKMYLGARGIKFKLFPNSSLHKSTPRWVMAMQLIETSQLYAHYVAKIEPEWIEKNAKHLLKYHHSEPRWEKKTARVVANEKVNLYGLPVIAKRKVHFGPLDPSVSREIFIRAALVQGEYQTAAKFFQHNEKLIADVEQFEHKSRRRDVLVDETVLWQFFDQRIPDNIYNGHTFEYWLKHASPQEQQALFLKKNDLMSHAASTITEEQFPKFMQINNMDLALSYHFLPGDSQDGVTVTLPIETLHQFEVSDFLYLVPGMLRDKLIELLRALPKNLRRALVPIPDFIDRHWSQFQDTNKNLYHVLSDVLRKQLGQPIDAGLWDNITIDDHYLMNFRVIDKNNVVLDMSRDLIFLQKTLSKKVEQEVKKVSGETWERKGITSWDFPDLAEEIVIDDQGLRILAYPSLRDNGDSVTLCVCQSSHEAQQLLPAAILRLLRLQLRQQEKYLKKNITNLDYMALQYTAFGTKLELQEDIIVSTFTRNFLNDTPIIRSASAFEQCITKNKAQLNTCLNDIVTYVGATLKHYHDLSQTLQQLPSATSPLLLDEIKSHTQQLLHPGFIQSTPWQWLPRISVYLQANQLRIEKYRDNPKKDQQLAQQWRGLWDDYQKRLRDCQQQEKPPQALLEYRWLLEEYRLSLFAQKLKTKLPISEKRLQKYLLENCC